MKSSVSHIQINVSDPKKSLPFYKDLLSYFGHKIIQEGPDFLGIGDRVTDFWLIETDEKYQANSFHRKNTGLNHLAFRVETKEDVDRFYADFLKSHNIPTLYNSPKAFPEYSGDYYTVFFEDLDRIKLEVMFNKV